jgi:hypothetical protein
LPYWIDIEFSSRALLKADYKDAGHTSVPVCIDSRNKPNTELTAEQPERDSWMIGLVG